MASITCGQRIQKQGFALHHPQRLILSPDQILQVPFQYLSRTILRLEDNVWPLYACKIAVTWPRTGIILRVHGL